ncbi:MAG: type II toxin-antitoxin system HicB family antitoxin [Halothece sp.]
MIGKYKVVIEWSQEDNCYVVSLPDFEMMQPCTHGQTYQEAIDNAQDVIELLEDIYDQKGKSLPANTVNA